MAETAPSPRSAFAGLLRPTPGRSDGAGVTISPRPGLRIATVIGRGPRAALAEGLRRACGLDLPDGPRRTAAGGLTALGVGPRTWLVLEACEPDEDGSADAAADLVHRLAEGVGATAAVCDQSDGYAVLRVAGPAARAVLAKGLGLDLHPRAFDATRVAVSSCSHIGVTIWQVDDAPSFEIALPRSYAGSFTHWLLESAAACGCRIAG